jgi:hypothetical protein
VLVVELVVVVAGVVDVVVDLATIEELVVEVEEEGSGGKVARVVVEDDRPVAPFAGWVVNPPLSA